MSGTGGTGEGGQAGQTEQTGETGEVAASDALAGEASGVAGSSYPVCPLCGATNAREARFCEGCAFELVAGADPTALDGSGPGDTAGASAPPPVACVSCGEGCYLDGYCDVCGSKQPDPRDHYEESPAAWVAGVCDIGRRHHRNEDAIALAADASPLSRAVLVVCDGVSNSTDSHLASLAAARAARDVLAVPVARGMGTRTALVASIEQRLTEAVLVARQAVVDTTADRTVESPPSCTVVAALVVDGLAVVGVVGDSRAYWVPDETQVPRAQARQLARDDSFAAELIATGVPREEAESGPNAHAITRWLGLDSPDDLTPHTEPVDLDQDGWLLVCSDGLWNYCSDAADVGRLVHDTVAALGPLGHHPPSLAAALTEFALEQGGADNVSVVLARVGALDAPASPAQPAPDVVPDPLPSPDPRPDGKDTP